MDTVLTLAVESGLARHALPAGNLVCFVRGGVCRFMVKSLIDTTFGTVADWGSRGKVHYSERRAVGVGVTGEFSLFGLSSSEQRAAVALLMHFKSNSQDERFSSMTGRSADLLTAAGADRDERPTAKSAPSGVALWHTAPLSVGTGEQVRLEWVCNRPSGTMPVTVLAALDSAGSLRSVLVAAKDTPVTRVEIP